MGLVAVAVQPPMITAVHEPRTRTFTLALDINGKRPTGRKLENLRGHCITGRPSRSNISRMASVRNFFISPGGTPGGTMIGLAISF
jgi:hypothetical protein